jgi:NADH-quinone oxidoreductase subunit H
MFSTLVFFNYQNTIILVFFILLAFTFVWVRGTFPRFRYDKLMSFAWTSILPFSLMWLLLVFGLSVVF